MTDTADTNNYRRLIEAGFEPDDILEIAQDAATTYDRNRKPFGSRNGALGAIGRSLFDKLAEEPDAFTTHHPFSSESVAEKSGMSRNGAVSAINRLIEHGFMERERVGRGFTFRLKLPDVALAECATRYLEPSEPGTLWHDYNRPLGVRLAKLYPQPVDTV